MPCIYFFVLFSHLPEACPPVALKERARDRLFLDPTCLKKISLFYPHTELTVWLGLELQVFPKNFKRIALDSSVSNVIVEESNADLVSGPLHMAFYPQFWKYVESFLYPQCSNIPL